MTRITEVRISTVTLTSIETDTSSSTLVISRYVIWWYLSIYLPIYRNLKVVLKVNLAHSPQQLTTYCPHEQTGCLHLKNK